MNSRNYNWNALSSIIIAVCCLFSVVVSACSDQAQQADTRLKFFKVVDSRILIEGNNAEVFGDVQNSSTMKFPFDVTLQANLMDNSGQFVGTATGTAEDVGPGVVRQFLLVGTVNGASYAKMSVTPVSLQEKRQELGMPTPTPYGS